MKRISTGALLMFLVFLVNPTYSTRAQKQAKTEEERRLAWVTEAEGVKVLRLWKTGAGPRWPEIAILQLSEERHKQLERDPMAFVKEYKIFDKVDEIRGHSVLQLRERKAAVGNDPPFVTAMVHDSTTYMGYASFHVQTIQP